MKIQQALIDIVHSQIMGILVTERSAFLFIEASLAEIEDQADDYISCDLVTNLLKLSHQ